MDTYKAENSNMTQFITDTGIAPNGGSQKNKHPLEFNEALDDNWPLKRCKIDEDDYIAEETDLSARYDFRDIIINEETSDVLRMNCFTDDGGDISGSIDRLEVGKATLFDEAVKSVSNGLTHVETAIIKNHKYEPLTEDDHFLATYGRGGVKPFGETLAKYGRLESSVHNAPRPRDTRCGLRQSSLAYEELHEEDMPSMRGPLPQESPIKAEPVLLASSSPCSSPPPSSFQPTTQLPAPYSSTPASEDDSEGEHGGGNDDDDDLSDVDVKLEDLEETHFLDGDRWDDVQQQLGELASIGGFMTQNEMSGLFSGDDGYTVLEAYGDSPSSSSSLYSDEEEGEEE